MVCHEAIPRHLSIGEFQVKISYAGEQQVCSNAILTKWSKFNNTVIYSFLLSLFIIASLKPYQPILTAFIPIHGKPYSTNPSTAVQTTVTNMPAASDRPISFWTFSLFQFFFLF